MTLVEIGAGIALTAAPTLSVHLLLGSTLDNSAALVIARMVGIALTSLGIACYFARRDSHSPAGKGLLGAMLFYNFSVAALFAYSGLALATAGVLLWPVTILHAVLALACLTFLLKNKS